ncbi:MFS transporter [Streptomyces sp. NPDC058583]|uniref:MFS transporter n=1 Tax=unclassified Streptomyces TaxID=2593676 RepID=UPI00364BFACB
MTTSDSRAREASPEDVVVPPPMRPGRGPGAVLRRLKGERPRRVAGNRMFSAYLAGESASVAGTSVHFVALPVLAVVELHATPGQIATLAALSMAPAAVLALPAGTLVDRYSKRTFLISTDLAAALVVIVVPVSWAAGVLSLPVLYTVAVLLGSLTVLHQAAAIAIVPELVDREHLHKANARVGAAFSVADTAGMYAGTAVVGLVGAARSLVLDAVSYLAGAWCATRLHVNAPPQRPGGTIRRMPAEIRAGVAYVMRTKVVRTIVLALCGTNLGASMISTFFPYYLLTVLDSGSSGLGLVMGATATGAIAGSLAGPKIVRRIGPGRLLMGGFLLVPLAGIPLLIARPGTVWLVVLAVAGAVQAAAAAAAGAMQRSIRQTVTPPELQGRAQQTSVWLTGGVRPLASAAAGGLAALTGGVWGVLLAGHLILLAPVALLWCSPVRHLRSMPADPLNSPDLPAASTEGR